MCTFLLVQKTKEKSVSIKLHLWSIFWVFNGVRTQTKKEDSCLGKPCFEFGPPIGVRLWMMVRYLGAAGHSLNHCNRAHSNSCPSGAKAAVDKVWVQARRMFLRSFSRKYGSCFYINGLVSSQEFIIGKEVSKIERPWLFFLLRRSQ